MVPGPVVRGGERTDTTPVPSSSSPGHGVEAGKNLPRRLPSPRKRWRLILDRFVTSIAMVASASRMGRAASDAHPHSPSEGLCTSLTPNYRPGGCTQPSEPPTPSPIFSPTRGLKHGMERAEGEPSWSKDRKRD